ncbi:hypothetical protein BT63DRAFT_457978 [Microthyrium microscopicum]|uniref:BTB domain-containing protein n=1 Tax=Microthyrium microscopicum TaxID=703497 RepID=A0A6A6U614_9PEZI|nr:hypothetical protein BT63DRAFT_457978 [Microthyrium microscopicum]
MSSYGGSDCTVLVDFEIKSGEGRKSFCHKLVLGSESKWIRDNCIEQHNYLRLDGMEVNHEHAVVELAVDFAYTKPLNHDRLDLSWDDASQKENDRRGHRIKRKQFFIRPHDVFFLLSRLADMAQLLKMPNLEIEIGWGIQALDLEAVSNFRQNHFYKPLSDIVFAYRATLPEEVTLEDLDFSLPGPDCRFRPICPAIQAYFAHPYGAMNYSSSPTLSPKGKQPATHSGGTENETASSITPSGQARASSNVRSGSPSASDTSMDSKSTNTARD